MHRILAIDPGFDRLGIAVLEGQIGKEKLLYSTTIQTDRKDTHSKRLRTIGDALSVIIKLHLPTEATLEKLFFATNAKTIIPVAEARGVLLYVCEEFSLPIYEYSPPEIKVAITGYGKATKADILIMVKRLIKLPEDRKIIDDEIDAIAIGLTHNAMRNFKKM